jgi:hypothetical protein
MWWLIAAVAGAAPVELPIQARLLDPSGAPVTGSRLVTVEWWDDASSADLAHRRGSQDFTLQVEGGFVSVAATADDAWFGAPLYVLWKVDGSALGPRQLVRPAAQASRAAQADVAAGVGVASVAPATPCTNGALILDQSIGGPGVLRVCSAGAWVPPIADGSTRDLAARDCKALHASHPSLPSGNYWVKPDHSATAFKAYCDMSTAGGGWTLCLNSRYTSGASFLFDDEYNAIYARNNDPSGYYDWCPQTAGEYLFSLADYTAPTWQLKTATLHVTQPSPYNEAWEWTVVGIQFDFANATWLNYPSGWPQCTGGAHIDFFEYVDPTHRSLRGFKRGVLNCTVQTGNPGKNFVMGVGCNYGSCPTWNALHDFEGTDVFPTYSQWTWKIVASAGIGNNTWNNGPIREDRTLMFYR